MAMLLVRSTTTRQILRRTRRRRSSMPSSSSRQEEPVTPLIELCDARLGYPNSQPFTPPIHMTVDPPTQGGHALLGRNGSGKSLVVKTIVSRGDPSYLQEGTLTTAPKWHSRAIAHVSFDSHQELLQQGGSTHKAIGEGGNLTKAAQFLVVRFGLFPLLQREVRTLSTGEIRKVLLVRALANRPKLLILDNAFDGLDVPSREVLKDLVKKTINGFSQDILVQAVNSQSTAHTQIVMTTHRPEELVDELQVISWYDCDGDLRTESRKGRSGLDLLELALGANDGALRGFNWNDDISMPSIETVQKWWMREDRDTTTSNDPLVEVRNMSIVRGDATLLHNLDWTILPKERWLVGGGNGAGKSSLSRLLAEPEEDIEQLDIAPSSVGWVSTEKHMEWTQSDEIVNAILLAEAKTASSEIALAPAEWLGIYDCLDQPFSRLSQGQQKLVLVAAALAGRPKLLVLDEPCQGLDGWNRRRLLTLIERICQATDISLVYITHHLEELLPSVTHALHLKERRDVYNGPIDDYRPGEL